MLSISAIPPGSSVKGVDLWCVFLERHSYNGMFHLYKKVRLSFIKKGIFPFKIRKDLLLLSCARV